MFYVVVAPEGSAGKRVMREMLEPAKNTEVTPPAANGVRWQKTCSGDLCSLGAVKTYGRNLVVVWLTKSRRVDGRWTRLDRVMEEIPG